MKKINSNGFTIIETILFIAIIGVFAGLISIYVNVTFKNFQAKQLAEQSIVYAKYFSDYINNNEAKISELIKKDSSIIISIDGIKGGNSMLLPMGFTKKNIFGQTPCVSVTKNSANKLFPMLFYVGSDSDKQIVLRTALLLGAKGGYQEILNNTMLIKSGGGWEIDETTPYLRHKSEEIQNTCGNAIARNSVFLNIAMLPYFNHKEEINDFYLSRESDLMSKAGSSKNRNTLKADIYLNSERESIHAIQFNNLSNTESIYIRTINKNEIGVQGGSFAANSLRAYEKKIAGNDCLKDELGKIYGSNVDESKYQGLSSSLVCSYSPIMCALFSDLNESKEYCYVPIKSNKVQFNTDEHGNNFWQCPSILPIAMSATYDIAQTKIQYSSCTRNNNDIENAATCTKYQDLLINFSPFKKERFFSPSNQQYKEYKVKIGYELEINSEKFCEKVCSDPKINKNVSRFRDYKSLWRCFCGNSSQENLDTYVIAQGVSLDKIKNITCTDKLILNKN